MLFSSWIDLCFLQRIQILTTPSDDLPKTKREQERLLVIFAPEADTAKTTNGYFPVSERDSNLWRPSGGVQDYIFNVLHPGLHFKDS